jgi:hypothetical protein
MSDSSYYAAGAAAVVTAAVLLSVFTLYFAPTIIAYFFRRKYFLGILVINFFLGWTIIGWVGALAWSVSSPRMPGLPPSNTDLP